MIGIGVKAQSIGMVTLLPDLAHLSTNQVVLSFDQRGGRSSLLADTLAITARNFVRDVEVLRPHFRLERMTVPGHSWGGARVGSGTPRAAAAHYPRRRLLSSRRAAGAILPSG